MDGQENKFDPRGFIFTLLALAILAGAGFFMYRYITENKIADLKTNGKLLETTFASIEINWNLKINNQSPYQIHTVWVNPETEAVYYFKSKNLWRNPDGYVPKMIKVYVDPDNYKNYLMDLSFLEPTKE